MAQFLKICMIVGLIIGIATSFEIGMGQVLKAGGCD